MAGWHAAELRLRIADRIPFDQLKVGQEYICYINRVGEDRIALYMGDGLFEYTNPDNNHRCYAYDASIDKASALVYPLEVWS